MAQNASAKPVEAVSINIATDEDALNVFGEVSSVASATRTSVVTYTVPSGKTFFLERVEFSGENIARYEVQIDASIIARKRTWFGGNISGEFDFTSDSAKGPDYVPGTVVRLYVEHNRPMVGDFDGRIQGIIKG